MRSHRKLLLAEPSLIYFVPALHTTRGQREAKECNVVIESKRLRPLLYRPKLNGEEDRRQVVTSPCLGLHSYAERQIDTFLQCPILPFPVRPLLSLRMPHPFIGVRTMPDVMVSIPTLIASVIDPPSCRGKR